MLGSGIATFSILPSSKPMHLDLKGHQQLNSHARAAAADLSSAALSLSYAQRGGGNPSSEWKWKQVEAPGPRVGLI
jgi:hypothetical protein